MCFKRLVKWDPGRNMDAGKTVTSRSGRTGSDNGKPPDKDSVRYD